MVYGIRYFYSPERPDWPRKKFRFSAHIIKLGTIATEIEREWLVSAPAPDTCTKGCPADLMLSEFEVCHNDWFSPCEYTQSAIPYFREMVISSPILPLVQN